MKKQFPSVSNLKALARTLALLAAWALIIDIDLKDIPSSRSSNIDSSLPVVADSASHAAISLSTIIGNPFALQTCDPTLQQLTGSVTPGDGSTPTSTYVHLNQLCPVSFYYLLPAWGSITVKTPSYNDGWFTASSTPYALSPCGGAYHCELDAKGCRICTGGNFDFKLYALFGNFSGTVTLIPEEIPAPAGTTVYAAHPNRTYNTQTEADGSYIFPPTDLGATPSRPYWGVRLYDPLRPLGGVSEPLSRTYRLGVQGGRLEDEVEATTYSSQIIPINLVKRAPYMEEPSIRSCPAAGEPVSIATGNMYLDQTDIVIPSLGNDLDFVRSYNSQLAYRNIAGGFGPGWTHPYEQKLSFPSTGIIMLRQGDGVPSYFQDMDANLTYDASVPFNKESWVEKQTDGSYIRRMRKGGYETYDSAGRLTSLVDPFGNTTTLGRDGSHRLTSINGPGSRSLTLTYNANRVATLSGPAGLIATYTYNPSNLLEKVAYIDGRGYTFNYDSNRQLITLSDLSGKVLETHTDSGNKAITSEISDGREKYTLSYNPLQTTVTDALGNATTYDWTNIWGMKYVTKITGPCASCGAGGNQTQQWTYDDKGRVLSYTDGNENKITYVYDANGDLISETDAGLNLTTYTIGSDGRRTSMTVKSVVDPAQEKVTTYEYDRGNLKNQTESGLLGDGVPYTHVTSYSYDSNGNLISIDGPRTDVGDITTFGYDSNTGDLTSVTQPEVGKTSYSNFTPLGQPQTVTDPNGLITTYRYDPQKRISSVAMGVDTTRYTYSPSGKLMTLTLPRRNTTTYVYDTFDRLVSIRDPLGNAVQYTYDLMGRPTKEEIVDGNGIPQKWVSFEYDRFNQLQKIVNPDSAFTEYKYDEAGNRTRLTTPRGFTTTYQYDVLNRLRATIQPGAVESMYGYDTQDNLTSVTDPNGYITKYFFDDLARIYREISPDTGTTTYTYDEAGNRISKTDARGVTIHYKYDALNRLTQIDFPSDADITYTYDTCQNGKGRLCQVMDQSGATRYRYDVKGQLIQLSRAISGVSGGFVTRYSYDPNGNLTSITYPSGRKVAYTFDLADRVRFVSTTPPGGSLQTLASKITYKPFGGVSSFTYGNGLPRTLRYDNQYRITAIRSGSVQRLAYSYDRNGNILAIKNLIDTARNKTFKYDGLDRLRAATGPWGSLAWTYDGAGNRLTQTDKTGKSTYTYRIGTNQLASVSGLSPITFRYDLSGNTIAENTRRYIYNQNGRLNRVRVGARVLGTYTYNANGQRVTKAAGGATTNFHYDGQGQLIAETRPNGNLVVEYIYLNGQPLARVVGSTLTYIHTDHLGTPVVMTNTNKKKVWEIETRPFGDGATISETATLNLRFPGQYFDQETRLNQNWFREYSSVIGRYIEPDPIGTSGNRSNTAMYYRPKVGIYIGEDPVRFNNGTNFYLYVRNDPANSVDPTGLIAWKCGVAITTASSWLGGANLTASCESECIGGKRLRQILSGFGVGGSVSLPWVVGGTYGEYTLYDALPGPTAFSLPGLWTYAGVGVAGGALGYSYSALTLGGASSLWSWGWQVGTDVGIDAYSGFSVATSSKWECCK